MTLSLEQQWQASRRQFLLSLLAGTSAAALPGLLTGCNNSQASIPGKLLGADFELGHKLRDRQFVNGPVTDWEQTETVIIGGGIAGLSAAWRLLRAGQTDFCVLELEAVAGGTSRSDRNAVTAYPWGAHYVPMPHKKNATLLQLFEEMGAVSQTESGDWDAAEAVACREPQERLFAARAWLEGLYPHQLASEQDLQQWTQFQQIVYRWIDWRDAAGRRAFTIPLAHCSRDPEVLQLDEITATAWLDSLQLTSRPLRWLVDYCCRDDYGLTSDQTSAWAALFYFASRIEQSGNAEAPLLTWPAGNGEIVNYLQELCGPRLQTGKAVVSLKSAAPNLETRKALATDDGPASEVEVRYFDVHENRLRGIRAGRVIFAAPQFLAPYLISALPEERRAAAREFQYGAWIVANLHLSGRPQAGAVPLSWDNVLYESPSLGYVVATHQTGSDYGPTVWTWYLPLCDSFPAKDRQRLLNASREEWLRIILADLAPAHPDLRQYLEQVDVYRWGHAMIQPRPGFISGQNRLAAASPCGNIHFAGTDLSGVALMEEAFYHGVRAADEVLTAL